MRFRIIRPLLAGLLSIALPYCAFGQSTNATLSGVVLDAQGAVVPNVDVVAVEIGTGQSHETKSANNGEYTVTDLPIGDYKITAAAEGFKGLVIPLITLHVNQAASLDLKLEVGAVSEHIVVTTTLPLLNTDLRRPRQE